MYELGSKKANIVVKVVGGGTVLDDKGVFDIGKRNYGVLRKLLWRNNIMIAAEDVRGSKSRTVWLTAQHGGVIVSSQGKEREL